MTRLLVCAPLGIEARAVRRGLPPSSDVRVVRTGMRVSRYEAVAPLLGACEAMAVVGFGGALDPALRPGAVLVATEVLTGGRRLPCAGADLLADELAREGVDAATGPLLTSDRLVWNVSKLSHISARAVDMEAGLLLKAAAGLPVAVVRVIVDTPDRPLPHPATLTGGLAARRTLRRVGPALVRWSEAIAPRVTPSEEAGS